MEEKAVVTEHQFSVVFFLIHQKIFKILTPVKKVLLVMINHIVFKCNI